MSESPPDDDLLAELARRWEELCDGGEEVPPRVVCVCAGHPERTIELESWIRALQRLEGFLGTGREGFPIPPPSACRAGLGGESGSTPRYRVLRHHARGGLGEVFVAEDCELHREVAFKQILQEHADDCNSRARFLLEAEITGGLEHPSIVPVYGLGTEGDGRPYYAMRFIRGDTLEEAIDRYHAGATAKQDLGQRSMELRRASSGASLTCVMQSNTHIHAACCTGT